MAGDWIKMRGNLWDDPRVCRLCDICDVGEAQIIGGLYWLWSTADQHTEDGRLSGLSLSGIDRKTGTRGFAAALVTIGWLIETSEGVEVPRFDEHNGSSAKRRASEAQRKANARSVSASDADKQRTECGHDAYENGTSCVAREEKRREEEETPPTPSPGVVTAAAAKPARVALAPGFDSFWAKFPKRRNKAQAEKAWAKLRPEQALVDRIVKAVEVAARRDDWQREDGRFVPHPATWLNARGWEDDDLQPRGNGMWWRDAGYGSLEAARADGVEMPA
jgi:hypothetical protein